MQGFAEHACYFSALCCLTFIGVQTRTLKVHHKKSSIVGQHETQTKNWISGVWLNGTLPLISYPSWSRDSNMIFQL